MFYYVLYIFLYAGLILGCLLCWDDAELERSSKRNPVKNHSTERTYQTPPSALKITPNNWSLVDNLLSISLLNISTVINIYYQPTNHSIPGRRRQLYWQEERKRRAYKIHCQFIIVCLYTLLFIEKLFFKKERNYLLLLIHFIG